MNGSGKQRGQKNQCYGEGEPGENHFAYIGEGMLVFS